MIDVTSQNSLHEREHDNHFIPQARRFRMQMIKTIVS